MLDFLRTQPNYSVDSVEVFGNEVAFLYPKALSLHETAEIVGPQGGQATVCLEGCRRHSGLWLHIGRIESGELHPSVFFQEEIRREPRLDIGLRVRSLEFSGFSAITNDLSEKGLQLTSQEPLSVASLLGLTLDFDDGSDSLNLNGVVRWCQLSPPCRVGVQFVDVTAEQTTFLRSFLRSRVQYQLPGLPESEPSGISEKSSTLRAEVVDGFRHGEFVVLRLKTDDEVTEYRYARPEVGASELQVGSIIHRIDKKSDSEGRFRYSFYDQGGDLALEVVSSPPVVSVRAL